MEEQVAARNKRSREVASASNGSTATTVVPNESSEDSNDEERDVFPALLKKQIP
jgi:hypothetical protein